MTLRPTRPIVRPRVALIALAAVAAAGLVLLSDRASLLLGRARDRYDTPEWFPWSLDNAALHFALWMAVALLATVAMRSFALRLMAGFAVLVASLGLEVLQTQLTFTRRFEAADVAANLRGVIVGAAVGLVIGAILDQTERRRVRR